LSFLLSLIRLGSRLNPPRYHKASVACPSWLKNQYDL
jgi:hypothetical protein